MTIPTLDLAPSGPQVSRLALGTWHLARWRLSDEELLDLLHRCLDMGITTVDLADIYGDYTAEELFGRALALEPSLRYQLQIVTKCGIKLVSPRRPAYHVKHYDTGREHILASAENSLRLLHAEHLDLLLLHRPDPLLDAGEVAEAFQALRAAGKVLHFGVSNFAPWQFDLLASHLPLPLVTNQVGLSLLNTTVLTDGTIDQCQRLGISPMAWSPLAGGRLFQPGDEQSLRVHGALEAVGREMDVAADQVALAWILRHPARIVPILGTGRLERMQSAVAAARLHLSRQQWFALWTASMGQEVP